MLELVLFVENQFTRLRKLRHRHRHVEYTLVILICTIPFLAVPTHRGEETITHRLVEVWILFKKCERHKILTIGGGCNLALLAFLVSFIHMVFFFHLLFATNPQPFSRLFFSLSALCNNSNNNFFSAHHFGIANVFFSKPFFFLVFLFIYYSTQPFFLFFFFCSFTPGGSLSLFLLIHN